MANVQNNSNANSSLVNTMLGSDSLMNPNVYSTKMIVPPHALTYSPMDPSNGSVITDGSTTNFTVNKYGIISQILFSYEKTVTGTGGAGDKTVTIGVNDVFSVIEKVELLSSSRVISTLTRYDLMSQFSSLPLDTFIAIDEGCVKPRTVVVTGTASKTETYTIPLVFGFMLAANTQLNASFLEPLSVKIYYGKTLATAAVANTSVSIANPKIMVRYKNYQEEANAKILAENFENPTLNLLLCRYYDENRSSLITTAAAAGEARTLQVELKNTDCVEDFYFVLVKSEVGGSATVPGDYTDFTPQEITNLKFTGSGQEFCNLNESQLNYGRIDSYGFAHVLPATASGSNLARIKTFQTGIYDSHVMENTLSLREINNPLVEVSFTAVSDGTNATQYSLYVVEKCSSIYAINSATGSLQISLSN